MSLKDIHWQFEEVYGEPGYSVYRLRKIFAELGQITIGTPQIAAYVEKYGLAIDLREDENIGVGESRIKSLIPKSNLEKLMNGLGIEGTLKNIEEKERLLDSLKSSNNGRREVIKFSSHNQGYL